MAELTSPPDLPAQRGGTHLASPLGGEGSIYRGSAFGSSTTTFVSHSEDEVACTDSFD
jgi:hypothetical protein